MEEIQSFNVRYYITNISFALGLNRIIMIRKHIEEYNKTRIAV